MKLTASEKSLLAGEEGSQGERMAFALVIEAARMLGARELVPIRSAHIDGCLYHGSAGVLYCEALAAGGARVQVPATTNVGALNLLRPDQCRLSQHERGMAYRLMMAHEKMGCRPSWTCAPYQAGARPGPGQQVAWGESNAVAFANTVLGARTNRYGDFLDIACAVSGRAPYYGLHVPENRFARLVIDTTRLPVSLKQQETFFPVLGALVGRLAGETVCAVTGVPGDAGEDDLKALCAAAASTGAVALIHLVGLTPEAKDLDEALGGQVPQETIRVTPQMYRDARAGLSCVPDGPIDSVAFGSPHFSEAECRAVLRLAGGRPFSVPVYICTGRHTLTALQSDAADRALQDLGAEFVLDTCVVVTPILPAKPGVMMTNSGKFAHYAPGNTGHQTVFGSTEECVRSAQSGGVVRQKEPLS